MGDNITQIKRTSQAIDNLSFDENYLTNAVEVMTEDPSGVLVRQTAENLSVRFVTVSGVTYIGEATIGAAESSAVWRVSKVEAGTYTWADGNASFDNVWNDYLTITYS